MTYTPKFLVLQDSGAGFLNERANIFDNMRNVPISVMGDGLGLYSHSAFSKGLSHYITDQGYMKMLYETGILGIGLRMVIVLLSLKRAVANLRTNHFEFLIIIMFLISLTGANSFSSIQMHNLIFWFCCGRIWNTDSHKYVIDNRIC